jgi:hypothetical protein
MRNTPAKLATSIVLILVLAPLSPMMAWHGHDHDEHGDMPAGEDCSSDGMPQRCAGLWSSACCDFTAASRATKDVPGGSGLQARHISVVATAPIGLLSAPTFAPFSPGFLLEDRAGPPLPRLLSTVLLI